MRMRADFAPCCATPDPEGGLAGRCATRARAGRCNESSVGQLCPVACERCVRCVGACGTSALSGARDSIMDDAWCSTWPRCSLFGCCRRCHRPSLLNLVSPPTELSSHHPLLGHPRTLRTQSRALLEQGIKSLPFTTPSQYDELARREQWRVLYLAHGQSVGRLPREYGPLAASVDYPRRALLFLAFDKNETRARSCRRGRTSIVCDKQRRTVIHFPNSTVNEGRNMLYLAAREQEVRQGWLYNYIVMLDEDLEFEVAGTRSQLEAAWARASSPSQTHWRAPGMAAAAHARGASSRERADVAMDLPSTPIRDYPQTLGGKGSRIPWHVHLDHLLSEWERWLSFRQPAVGALCWGASCIPGARIWHASTCHADHKIVAYHREALETLLPMPTHRDRDCWWAGQFSQTLELSLLLRGGLQFHPGALRVLFKTTTTSRQQFPLNPRGSAGHAQAAVRKSQYERHAVYPREKCFDNYSEPLPWNATSMATNSHSRGTVLSPRGATRGAAARRARRRSSMNSIARPGIFSLIHRDLSEMLRGASVGWSSEEVACFDKLVARCRAHGEIDLPVAPARDTPYYTDAYEAATMASTATRAQRGLVRRIGPCV